jgi:signal transduction histidine kinase/CheY-like chemotaxis protein/HPt (histidine-containing phosphotransfer) domain-containing protein
LLALIFFSLYARSTQEYEHELLDENDGFSSSIIFSIVQDDDGFLWFGTGYTGIMRFDGKNVVALKNNPNQNNSLPNDNAGNLTFDYQSNLWIGSWGGGVIKKDAKTKQFEHYPHFAQLTNSIGANRVQTIFEDDDNELWFGTYSGGLNKFDSATQDFLRLPIRGENNNGISNARVWVIEQADPGKLWIGTDSGLNLLDKQSQYFSHYFVDPSEELAGVNKIRKIIKAANADLYLGTQDGVVYFDTTRDLFTPIESDDESSIGVVYSMLATTFGEYWVSSDKGVYSFTDADKTLRKVPLNFDDSCSQMLFQDKQDTVWLSCEGVGIYKITRPTIFKLFEDRSVKNAFALEAANDDSILIGTSQLGLQKWVPETNQLIRLGRKRENDNQAEIKFIAQTARGDIWYANNQSLFTVNKDGLHIEVLPPEHLKPHFKNISEIGKDSESNIWVMTPNGLFTINPVNLIFRYISSLDLAWPENKVVHNSQMYSIDKNTMWLSKNNTLYKWDKAAAKAVKFSLPADETESARIINFIYSIFVDSQDRIWISNKTGLHLVDPSTGKRSLFSSYFVETKNRGIRYISEDKNGFLWLVTPVGLSRLEPSSGDLQHFDKRDGLSGSRIFYNPTVRKSDGTFYIASRDGITHFDPLDVSNSTYSENTLLTNFNVLGSSEVFNVSQIESTGIKLNYDQSNIRFEFATLDLLNARQIEYSYFLEGFDNTWNENANNNTATYTNLSGGDYVFRVRAKIKDKPRYTEELSVNVNIGTPFWKQWWMVTVYIGLLLLVLYWYLQRQKNAVIELEREVARKTADIAEESNKLMLANQIKSQFLANMSHEIRTPLTTVIGQAEAIICRDVKHENIYREVEIIHDSSLYLLALLNDILDLTKIEENKFALEYTQQDLHGLLTNINTMFSIQARVKGLSFTLVEDLPKPLVVNIDELRLKQILINLLSNALKFTLKGSVSLEVVLVKDQLIFKVKDSGIGIDQDKIDQIFNSFTQGDSSIRRRFGGSGLGLHLSTQLAFLMRGSIKVESELDRGSIFTLTVPLSLASKGFSTPAAQEKIEVSLPTSIYKGKILLAEDHPQNRRLIKRLLNKLGHTVYEASDGNEAIALCQEHKPEIILMDIHMPDVDGLQAFKVLRELGFKKPIIALTANAMKNEVEEYLSLGFDAYIEKPIDRQKLLSTIAAFLSQEYPGATEQVESLMDEVDMSDLVAEFESSLVKELSQFQTEIEKRDHQALQNFAHRLAGASQLFGFTMLSQKASTLERALTQDDQSFDAIQTEIDALIDEIKRSIK